MPDSHKDKQTSTQREKHSHNTHVHITLPSYAPVQPGHRLSRPFHLVTNGKRPTHRGTPRGATTSPHDQTTTTTKTRAVLSENINRWRTRIERLEPGGWHGVIGEKREGLSPTARAPISGLSVEFDRRRTSEGCLESSKNQHSIPFRG